MDQFPYLFLLALIPMLAAAFIFARMRSKAKAKKVPEICIGAIRVTDRQGRDMLIIRKEDGSFEMHEEKIIRKQCIG